MGAKVSRSKSSEFSSNITRKKTIGVSFQKGIIEEHQEESYLVDYNKEKAVEKEFFRRDASSRKSFLNFDFNPDLIYENIQKNPNYKKTPRDISFLSLTLKNHFALYGLEDDHLENFIAAMFFCEVDAEEVVFFQSDPASAFFVLTKGTLEIIIDDERRGKIIPWQCFGELALLYNAPRSATIRAVETSSMFVIDRVNFKRACGEIVSKAIDKSRKFLDVFHLFGYYDEYQKDSISGLMYLHKFNKNMYIFKENDQAAALYILKEGSIIIEKEKQEIKKLKVGDVFGEESLDFLPSQYSYSVKASDNVKCFAISASNLIDVMGQKILLLRFEAKVKEKLSKSKYFMKSGAIALQKIVDSLEIQYFEREVIKIANPCKLERLWILLEGKISLINERIYESLEIFGDFSLFNEKEPLLLEEDKEMIFEGFLATISYSHISKILSSLHSYKERDSIMQEKKDPLKLEDFFYIKHFGEGLFGPNYLVKNEETNKLFVLKCVSKALVCEKNLEKHIIQEKEVLEKVSHPFIVQFYQCIKDNNIIYFINEYVRGIELFDFMRDMGLLTKKYSRFYIGSLVLVLEYLHTNFIIYRDVKPENILIDETGYPKVIDFGIAKNLNNKKTLKTFTIVGTPHYMAPEIVKGKGYTFSVDLWSLGVVIYELMCGGLPFAEDCENPYEIYEEIIKNPLVFPKFMKDKHAMSLMSQLMNKIPEMRLEENYENLKNHAWFEGFQWDKLINKELEPPCIPDEEKLLSNNEIQKLYKNKENLIDILKMDENPLLKKKYKKERARDPNWEKKI